MTAPSRDELLALADEEAAARARYHETDARLIRESEVREYALRLAANPADDGVREAAAKLLEYRAAGYSGQLSHAIFSGNLVAEELRANAEKIRALSPKAKP